MSTSRTMLTCEDATPGPGVEHVFNDVALLDPPPGYDPDEPLVVSEADEAAWHGWWAAGEPEGPSHVLYPWSPVYPWSTQPPDGVLLSRLLDSEPGELWARSQRLGTWARLSAVLTGHLYTEMAGLHGAWRPRAGRGRVRSRCSPPRSPLTG